MSVIDSTSPRIGDDQIVGCKLTLAAHQRAMVRRCLEIERNGLSNGGEAVGLMSDAPGTGKTFVVLAMVLVLKNVAKITRSRTGTNVIVVPQHIYAI